MSKIDDRLSERLRRAAAPVSEEDVLSRVDRHRRRLEVRRRIGSAALVVTVLAGTGAGVVVLNRAFGQQSTVVNQPVSSSPVLQPNLGLGFPVCDVSSMPVTIAGSPATAAVYSKATDQACPKHGPLDVGVGVDLDGDGALDATGGPVADCFTLCEAFAGPDVNGDGTSEIMVSTAGADGYGVEVFRYSATPEPSLTPIQVDDPKGLAPHLPNPLQFAWVDVAGHAELARCEGYPLHDFVLVGVDKLENEAAVTTLVIAGVGAGPSAEVIDISHERVALADYPRPGMDLCGSPTYGGATGVVIPPSEPAQTIAGVPFAVCRPMSIPGELGGELDTAWVFEKERVPGAGCSGPPGTRYVGIGSGASIVLLSGVIDESAIDRGMPVWPYATPDIDEDGIDEIAVGIGGSFAPEWARLLLFRVSGLVGDTEQVAQIHQVAIDCGPACDPVPWINVGTFVESHEGAYCGALSETGRPALVRWSTALGKLKGDAWYLEVGTLRIGDQSFSGPDDGSYPDDGVSQLCGSPALWPRDFPNYPAVQ